MLKVADDEGREWIAVSYDWSTAEFTWIPADTEVIIAPVPGTEAPAAEPAQLDAGSEDPA